MNELTRNAALREDLGQRAADSMARYQALAKEGRFIDELVTLRQNRAFTYLVRGVARALDNLWQAASQNDSDWVRKSRHGLQRIWDTHIAWRLSKTPSH